MEPFKYASLITTISVFVALFSIIFQGYQHASNLRTITNVLTSLMFIESTNLTGRTTEKPRIAIGYGSSLDLHVKATTFFNFTDAIFDDEFEVDEIKTERDLLHSFAYFFQRGIATERYTQNKDLFTSLVQRTKETRISKEIQYNIGGNAALMALRFAQEGAEVLLGSQASKKFVKVFGSNVKISEPLSDGDQDDLHLVFEYQSDEKWGKFTSPSANYYIIHSDTQNPELKFFDNFNVKLPEFNPRLIIIAGLQSMDQIVSKTREVNLKKIQNQIKALPRTTLIHFQMTCFFDPIFLTQLLENVISYSDSLGLNEQELENLRSYFEDGVISPPISINPSVSSSLDRMRSVFIHLHDRHRKSKKGRQPTRIHLRTLSYHIIMTTKLSEWTNTKQSTAKASLRTSKYMCGSEILNPESFTLLFEKKFYSSENSSGRTFEMKENDVVTCWKEILRTGYESIEVEFCVAPVLVCKRAAQTLATGDYATVDGLVLQI
uniref:CSON003110 protein n=1 Tax=Culicoides sonorensis TaxID=179676 RepID=A0A336KCP3_CULSO